MRNTNCNQNYVTYARQFRTYKWYKPIFVLFMMLPCFLFINCFVIESNLDIVYSALGLDYTEIYKNIGNTYEEMNIYTASGVIANCEMPLSELVAFFLAAYIIMERPVSSYSSSKGGWRMSLAAISLLCAAAFYTVCETIIFIIEGDALDLDSNRLTLGGIIMIIILVPFQCMSEEYFFRGLLMQTVGSWVRIPAIAIVGQAAIFGALHGYDFKGNVSICFTGIVYGIIAWRTNGIEVTSAIHTANNIIVILCAGAGISEISTVTAWETIFMDLVFDTVILVIVLYVDKKWHCFDKAKRDDITLWNEKKIAAYPL